MRRKEKANLESPSRLIVGLSGASGILFGVRLLEVLRGTGLEVHLVMSRTAEITLAHETDLKVSRVRALAHVVHSNADLGAAIASGSFKTLGMIIAPCSIRTASEIATGVTSTLMSRAADVALKERRRLVLMVRESPLHTGHLRMLAHLSEIGAVIAPPLPAFYTRPQSIDDIVDQTVGRTLDLFDIEVGGVKRWREPGGAEPPIAPGRGRPRRK